jgi:hypothetical protein
VSAHTLRQRFIASGDGGVPPTFSWKRFWNSLFRRATGAGFDVVSMRLAVGQVLRLHDVAGWTVICRSGAVWITQEADARDTFLSGGEGFALDRGGMTLVCACRDTVLSIRPPAGRGSTSRSQRVASGAGADPLSDDEHPAPPWLRALYPECGPWNDPAAFRRSGLI